MKKYKHIGSSLLILAVLMTMLCPAVLASTDIVEPSSMFYVTDDANVLSTATKDYVKNVNASLESSCGGQIVVVTIDFLNDLDAEQYAYEIMNQWGVGDKTKNNGAVLLLVTGQEKYWLTVGAGIEDALSAGDLDTILNDNFNSDFEAENYDTAVQNTVAALEDWYNGYYGTSDSSASTSYGGRETEETGGIMSFLMLIFLVVIIFVAMSGMGRRRGWGGPGIFFCGGPWCGGPPRGPRGPGGWGGGGFGGGGFGGFGGGGFGGGGFGGGGFGGMGHGGGGMGRGGGAGHR